MSSEKICNICDKSKTNSDFEPNRHVCKSCRKEQKNRGKEKACKNCKEIKLFGKFIRFQDICKDCADVHKSEHRRMCGICDEIKPETEFYGKSSWVCKLCSRKKTKERMAEVRECEICKTEKELKQFRTTVTMVCLDCEDDSVQRVCRDCKISKPITEFLPKRMQCHECTKADGRYYRATTTKAKEWVEKNSEKMAKLQKDHYEKHKKEIRQTESRRLETEDEFREIKNGRVSTRQFVCGKVQKSKILMIDRDDYILWLQYNFKDGQTVENYGKEWCIDHVIPLGCLLQSSISPSSEFIKSYPNHKKLLFCWYNTIPITQKENRLKSDCLHKNILRDHIININSFLNGHKNFKKDDLYFEYKKFITDILGNLH